MSNYDRIMEVLIEQIEDDLSGNIRENIDERALQGLALSIQASGFHIPLVLTRGETRPFRLLDGWRRLQAAKLLRLKSVPAVVKDKPLCDGERLQAQLIINCQRCDLTPLEKARAIKSLMEATDGTASQTARLLGMSAAGVTRAVRLLSLPQPVQQLIEEGRVAPSIGYAIAGIEDPQQQLALAQQAATGSLTRDEASRLSRHLDARDPATGGASTTPDGDSAAPHVTPGKRSSGTPAQQRFRAKLPGGSITVSAVALTPDVVIELLAGLLAKARRLKSRGVPAEAFLSSLSKLLKSA